MDPVNVKSLKPPGDNRSMSTRKRPPVPAHLNFQARRAEFRNLSLSERFERIARTNLWGADSSRSGLGSQLAATAGLREGLPAFLARHAIESILDVPCGDFAWLSTIDLRIPYIGADIVEALVRENERRFGGPQSNRRFVHLDVTQDPLPRTDAVLCRDCLVHLSFTNILRSIENMRASGARYLLTTTFLEHEVNEDIEDGDWRMLNLQRAPFNFTAPVDVLIEGCVEGGGAYADKALGLWALP
jgi:hypothetical protein